jgi:hypothetical protein
MKQPLRNGDHHGMQARSPEECSPLFAAR